MKFIGIIPARYASTRFPGKPLAMLGDKTVIQRVYEQACKELDDVVVATDDERIRDAVVAFGGKAVMTSSAHRSGTDRVREAYANIVSDADVVINIQGDEPFIHPSQIAALKACFDDPSTEIATLIRPFDPELGYEALENPNSPKVEIDDNRFALTFSRSVIPYLRNYPKTEWPKQHQYYTHVGIYAYKARVLAEITQLPQTSLEIAESLEQLRWIQNGYKIKTAETRITTIGIDTPEDLDRARRAIPPEVRPIGDLRLPAVKEETLSNGIVLRWLNGGTQAVNQLMLAFPGGRREAGNPAIASLCMQLLREGTTSKSGAEIAEALDFRGALMHNFAGEHYSIVSMSSLNSMSGGTLPLFREILLEPAFPEYAFTIYKDRAVKNFLQEQSKVAYLSNEAMEKLIMGANHPQAFSNTAEEIERVTRDDIIEFHNRVFTASRCQAFLSGQITEEIYADVKKMLESLPATKPAIALEIFPFTPEAPQQVMIEKPEALQDALSIAFPAPKRDDPDYIPLRFAVMALGGFFGSRLMKNVREEKGYTYGIRASLLGSLDGSYVSIQAQADPKYIAPMIEEIKLELDRLATVPADEEEMMRLRQHIGTRLIEILDSPFAIMEYYKTQQTVGFPKGYFQDQVRIAKELTPEKIMEMAQKYLRPSLMRIAIAGK